MRANHRQRLERGTELSRICPDRGRTVSYTGTDAWGQGSSGLKETQGETALGEPGTEPDDDSLSIKVQVSGNGSVYAFKIYPTPRMVWIKRGALGESSIFSLK